MAWVQEGVEEVVIPVSTWGLDTELVWVLMLKWGMVWDPVATWVLGTVSVWVATYVSEMVCLVHYPLDTRLDLDALLVLGVTWVLDMVYQLTDHHVWLAWGTE